MSQLEELRQIIIGANEQQLRELRERVESVEQRTNDVAEVLAPAISVNMSRDDSLISALKDPVSESLKRAIRAEPEVYAEILYPAIAPSIRNAIAQAISAMLATINKTVESATTLDGLKARYQSFRTGVPYPELLLRKSLLYRVEHVYLIDRESGLLIGECSSQENGRVDSDAVSAMFSAIQSFVQDSFSGEKEDRLTEFKVGSYSVWIAHGAKAMLASITLGDAPLNMKARLSETLDSIRLEYAEQIANFDGDSSQFVGLQNRLQPLLRSQMRDGFDQPKEKKRPIGPMVVYFLFVALLCYLLFNAINRNTKLATVNHYFDAAPGVVVTDAKWQSGLIHVEGLLDPSAQIPTKELAEHGIEAQDLVLDMTPFRSLDPEILLRKLKLELAPPAGLMLFVQNEQLFARGRAPVNWLLQHEQRLRRLSADGELNVSELFVTKESLSALLSNALVKQQEKSSEGRLDAAQLSALANQPWIELSSTSQWRTLLRSRP